MLFGDAEFAYDVRSKWLNRFRTFWSVKFREEIITAFNTLESLSPQSDNKDNGTRNRRQFTVAQGLLY